MWYIRKEILFYREIGILRKALNWQDSCVNNKEYLLVIRGDLRDCL